MTCLQMEKLPVGLSGVERNGALGLEHLIK